MNLNYEEQLNKLFSNVNEWLKFAEAKNFGLLTLNAALVFGFTQMNIDTETIKNAGNYIFIPFALFSFLFALLSLFPILTTIERTGNTKNLIYRFSNLIDKETHFENIHYYGYLRGIDIAVFESKFLAKTGGTHSFTDFEKELGIQILYNSRIAYLKFQLFKIGAFIFSLGVILSVISLPIQLIFIK